MNRTFEFRVWNSDNKSWLEDCDILISSDGHLCMNESQMLKGNFIIQQFTGLTDKNGKKIFEGDIVIFFFYKESSGGSYDYNGGKIKHLVVVEPDWEYHGALKPFHWADDSEYGIADMAAKNCEVVGNIFENKLVQNQKEN